MNSNLYRLIYCSRNRLQGGDAEVVAELQQILAAARKNNVRLGITGALLYNSGSFAQVIEGPLQSIESLFEVIQCDARHSEVTVIQSEAVAEREFGEWSMAFTDRSGEELPSVAAAFDSVFANRAAGAGDQVLSLLRELTVREDDSVLMNA